MRASLFLDHSFTVISLVRIITAAYCVAITTNVFTIGTGLTVRHFRNTSGQCKAVEEIEPIDQNLKYDFDFQVKI